MLAILVGVHLLHAKTAFGRQLVAMGNDIAIARKVGLPVDRTGFLSFVLAGVLASAGGILTTVQNGAVSPWLGSGLEFTALAVVVVGGISLLGGRGTILFSIIPGAFIFEMIRNGLTNLGANPYSYRLVGGAVIFAAMYADALKSGRLSLRRGTNSLSRSRSAICAQANQPKEETNETLHSECRAGRWALPSLVACSCRAAEGRLLAGHQGIVRCRPHGKRS